jgi:hypothetical protein
MGFNGLGAGAEAGLVHVADGQHLRVVLGEHVAEVFVHALHAQADAADGDAIAGGRF